MKLTKLLAAGTLLSVTVPASAAVTTFATWTQNSQSANFRFLKTATGGSFHSGTGSTPSAILVRFSFLQPGWNGAITNVLAQLTFTGTTTSAASLSGSTLSQAIQSGSFQFTSTSAITVNPHLTYAAGSVLLAGTFQNGEISGQRNRTSGGFYASTPGATNVVFSSDFMDFSNTVDRDMAINLTSITPALNRSGATAALNTFNASAGGSFSSDPLPLLPVPEPATWLTLILGFGAIGAGLRRRQGGMLAPA